MKKLMWLVLLAVPMLAWAESPFDGTWKVNLDSAQFPKKPDVYVIQSGMYECKTCVPPVKIKADGEWQKVSGHPYYDEMMVKIVDNQHMELATKKDGKEMYQEKDAISEDGKTVTSDWVDKSAPNGKEVTGKATQTRVAAGPSGSSAFSGSWRTEKMADTSSDALLFTYKSM